MGSIVSSGVGSGLDVAGLVQKLVEAEGGPKTLRLDAAEAKAQAQAVGARHAALGARELSRHASRSSRTSTSFRGREVALSKRGFLCGHGDGERGARQLRDRGRAARGRAQAAVGGRLPAATIVVGTGTLHDNSGGDRSSTSTSTATNNTLAGIAAAINESAAGAKVVGDGRHAARASASTSRSPRADRRRRTRSRSRRAAATVASRRSCIRRAAAGSPSLQPALDARGVLIDGYRGHERAPTRSAAPSRVSTSRSSRSNEDGETTTAHRRLQPHGRAQDDRRAREELQRRRRCDQERVELRRRDEERRAAVRRRRRAQHRLPAAPRARPRTSAGSSGRSTCSSEIGVTADARRQDRASTRTKLDAAFAADFDAIGELFAAKDVGVARQARQAARRRISTAPAGVRQPQRRASNRRSTTSTSGARR